MLILSSESTKEYIEISVELMNTGIGLKIPYPSGRKRNSCQ
jgi:hypothetical protein